MVAVGHIFSRKFHNIYKIYENQVELLIVICHCKTYKDYPSVLGQ